MKTIPILSTATHPADMHQHLVLLPVTAHHDLGLDASCSNCALLQHCRTNSAPTKPVVEPYDATVYNCTGGIWRTLEEYLTWNQML